MSPRIAADHRTHDLQARREKNLDAASYFLGRTAMRTSNACSTHTAGVEKGPLYLCFAGKDDIFQAVLDARLCSERPGALIAQDLLLEDMLLTHILLQDVLGSEEFSPVVQEVWMRESMRIFTAAIDSPGGLKTSVRRRRQSANSGGAESIPVADSAVSDSPGVERSSSYGK